MNTTDTLAVLSPFYQWDTPYVHITEVKEVDDGIAIDSLFPARAEVIEVRHESLFNGHSLKVQHDGLTARPSGVAPVWLFLMLMMLGGLHFLYFQVRKVNLWTLGKALFSRRSMDYMVRDSNLKVERLVPIGLLMAATMSALVWICWSPKTSYGVWEWLGTGAVLAVAYLLRNGVYRMLGNVFEGKNAVNLYITSNYCYHLALSTLMIPLLLLEVYLPWGKEAVAWVAIGLIALCFLLRFVRGINLFLTFSRNVSLYLFYYLCTIELAPVIVIVRLFLLQ